MMLIESPDGNDRCHVASLAGYEGWTVIADNVPAPPANCTWCEETNAWKPDPQAAALAAILAKVGSNVELAKIIADLTNRIIALEAK